jgi:hypothetical protein
MALWRHLNRCSSHLSRSNQSLLNLKPTSSNPSASSTWVFSQQASHDLLVQMIIAHEQPFTLVEKRLFQAFVASLQPKFKLFSRATLKKDVMEHYGTMKGKIGLEITQVDHIALTTDLWTSSNQSPFMVISAHFVSSDWTLNNRVISFKELPTPHTGIAIGDQLLVTMAEWKITDKVAFITVDNASSNDVAIDRVTSVLSARSSSALLMNGEFFHVRCAAHIINLVVKDGLKNISPAISKIRDSVRYTKSTPSRKQSFKDAIKHINMAKKALPSVDVPTRWNSTFKMLQSALPYEEAFERLSIEDANYTDCPTSEQWDKIKTMQEFLMIFDSGVIFLPMIFINYLATENFPSFVFVIF